MTEELRTKLQGMVDSHNVVLFMKGNRQQPQCGFSVVSILEEPKSIIKPTMFF